LRRTTREKQEKKGKVPGRRPTDGHIWTSETILQGKRKEKKETRVEQLSTRAGQMVMVGPNDL